jgi:uncharacterized repeat protein (TIGR03803 family)
MANKRHFSKRVFDAISCAVTVVLAITIALVLTALLTQLAKAQTYRVIYTFTGGADGAWPEAGLTVDQAGNLYGTTYYGGPMEPDCSAGCGTVFMLRPVGSNWILNPLYSFKQGSDGSHPVARVIRGRNGMLYGTTLSGGGGDGVNCDPDYGYGCGTVFNVQPPATACETTFCLGRETVLYRFTGSSGDGAAPESEVVFDHDGNMYGTSIDGGHRCEFGCGVVYKLTPSGGGWTESVIYTFQGENDGEGPFSGLVLDRSGNLYGTTADGGNLACNAPYGCGTVFQLRPSASGWTENVLYTFQGGNDGQVPIAGLIFDRSGHLYGATAGGGAGGGGTVFMLIPSHGSWTLTTLHSFTGVSGPWASLAMDIFGNLYGTTLGDGAYQLGSVFKLARGTGGWTYTTLHNFTGGGDGGVPSSSVVFDASGDLFGTASEGGAGCAPFGCGVVWEITP